jgi:transposase
MPPRTISHNLKDRIPVLFQQGYSVNDICDILGIRKSATYQVLRYFRDFGVPTNPQAQQLGRPRSLNTTDINFIKAILDCKHCLYLNEVQQGVHVSIPTIVRTL